jgi:hypothetical protein
MARFPLPEADVILLAQNLAGGLRTSAEIFPDPPVPPADLETQMTEVEAALAAINEAQAALEAAFLHKNAVLDRLKANMKHDLRYAENISNFQDEVLKHLGWSGRRPKCQIPAPGQPGTLRADIKDGGYLLQWKAPPDGGPVAAYIVQKRLRVSDNGHSHSKSNGGTADGWTIAATVTETQAVITNGDASAPHPTDYRVLAFNRTGQGSASNTVTIL